MLNGALLQNDGADGLELRLHGDAGLVNEADLIAEQDADTPASRLYYEVMLLCGGDRTADLTRTMDRLVDYADSTPAERVRPRCGAIEALLLKGQFEPALRIARGLLVDEGWRSKTVARKLNA